MGRLAFLAVRFVCNPKHDFAENNDRSSWIIELNRQLSVLSNHEKHSKFVSRGLGGSSILTRGGAENCPLFEKGG